MLELYAAISVFLSSSDSDGYIFALAVVGPASAVIFFKRMHKKYRNFDVTHSFEYETDIYGENMQKSDVFYKDRNRTREAHVEGRNSHTHRVRVQEF